MHSLLIAPGDDAARLEAALSSPAHAVVIDLDVAPDRREAARAGATRVLGVAQAPGAPALIVRVSPLDAGETDRDLDAIMSAAPFAVLLPKARGAASIQQLSAKLALREATHAIEDGATAIIALIDTAEGLLAAASLKGASKRLIGVAWDADALAAEVGAAVSRDAGGLADPLRTARDLLLFSAAAARVGAIDTALPATGEDALRAEAEAARRAGFIAKFACDPGQAAILNAVFDGDAPN